tara:strand:- start:6109 stop:6804 length:696 start_codon:yes stop_codon:yes gene_type:complete
MGRKKSKKNMYFHEGVQDAIIKYNQSEDDNYRSRIYGEEIHAAFDKLCENIINTFKFTYFDDVFEDVKAEVVSFLVMNMHKYDHTKGSKAFSYFSIVAKNYLILHNNANYKKLKLTHDISVLDYEKNHNHSDENYMNELTEEVIKYFDDNIPNIFKKQRDIDIAYSIIEILKRREEIENFNKKAIYILIREMTNVNTSKITSVVNTFKKHYSIILNNFYGGDLKKGKKIFF